MLEVVGVCRLCGNECQRFARSHLIPWGFMSKYEYANDMSLVSPGRRSRRMRKGVYDEHILCDSCEHKYFHGPDTYAIRVLRDLEGGRREEMCSAGGKSCRYYIFKGVDRRLLRSFFASVLWRFSVSHLACVDTVCIGQKYEARIAHDLMNDGHFDWIDAVGVVFDSDKQNRIIQGMNNGFVLPEKTRIRYANRIANGYNICFPKMKFCVSLDQRVNPFAIMGEELSQYDRRFEKVSPSLANSNDGKDLILFESEFPLSMARTMTHAGRNEKV